VPCKSAARVTWSLAYYPIDTARAARGGDPAVLARWFKRCWYVGGTKLRGYVGDTKPSETGSAS
jgi:hypothetical protein